MQHAAKPLDEGIGLLPLEIGGEALVFWPAGDDRSGNQAAFAHGNGADMIRFGLHNGGINIDLHMQRPGDASAPGLAGIGLVEEIMIEIRRLGKPRVVQRRPVDDVQMGIDEHALLLRARFCHSPSGPSNLSLVNGLFK